MAKTGETLSLFLSGDVMTGRGIDQILPHPCAPGIHEPWVRDARTYVSLAEKVNGPIPRPVDFDYVWGDALDLLNNMAPDHHIINLETAITESGEHWPGKGIHYRMHPANVPLLQSGGVDLAVLANNHVLDWGFSGFIDTLQTLEQAGILYAGAGRSIGEAQWPAILQPKGRGRILVFACGLTSSGILPEWGAAGLSPGIFLLPDLGERGFRLLANRIKDCRRQGDLVIVSIHWGGNWGYAVSQKQRLFAHRLLDEGGVALVHGHSSHHPQGIEVHRGKLIIYGAGDLVNDYEGIRGYEEFRGELSLMYFVRLEIGRGNLAGMRMAPMRMRNFRLHRADEEETRWLVETLNREGRFFGSGVELAEDGLLELRWG